MMRRTGLVRTLALALVASLLLLARNAGALCAPSAEGIFPASGIVGTTVGAVVPGMGLAGATASVVGSPGLDVAVQNASDLEVALQLTIDPAALPGERIVTLTTAAGAVNLSFTVNPAGGPIVAAVSPPPIITQGFPIVLSIAGENLGSLDLTQVSVTGTGMTVTAVTPAVDGLLGRRLARRRRGRVARDAGADLRDAARRSGPAALGRAPRARRDGPDARRRRDRGHRADHAHRQRTSPARRSSSRAAPAARAASRCPTWRHRTTRRSPRRSPSTAASRRRPSRGSSS